MRISDWSSDVCSSDLRIFHHRHIFPDGVIGFHLEPPPIRPHRRAYAVVAQQIGDLVGFNRVMECRHAIAELLCHIDDDGHFVGAIAMVVRSAERTSELQSLMRTSYAVFFLTNTTSPYNQNA